MVCLKWQGLLILPAVSLSRISPPRGGEYLHEVTAGSMRAVTALTSESRDERGPRPESTDRFRVDVHRLERVVDGAVRRCVADVPVVSVESLAEAVEVFAFRLGGGCERLGRRPVLAPDPRPERLVAARGVSRDRPQNRAFREGGTRRRDEVFVRPEPVELGPALFLDRLEKAVGVHTPRFVCAPLIGVGAPARI
ncbi:hypothetical protein BRC70_05430 [Halobacteriales archaeon QH_6_68_27]|nr:MAG: hypothetical protein BRC70_05430 [Halobacteriales archaeon QH_6_68_27]